MKVVGTYDTTDHKAKLMCGDPQAQAYQWILNYLENLNSMISEYGYDEYRHSEITLEELLYTAQSHIGDPWGDYISRGGVFEGHGTDPVFWDKLSILREEGIDHDKRGSFFSCSC